MRTIYHFIPEKRPEAFKRVFAAQVADGAIVVVVYPNRPSARAASVPNAAPRQISIASLKAPSVAPLKAASPVAMKT